MITALKNCCLKKNLPGETERGGTAFSGLWEHPVHLPQAQGRSNKFLEVKNVVQKWDQRLECVLFLQHVYIYILYNILDGF